MQQDASMFYVLRDLKVEKGRQREGDKTRFIAIGRLISIYSIAIGTLLVDREVSNFAATLFDIHFRSDVHHVVGSRYTNATGFADP